MFEVKVLESGYIMADGGAMFGAIPKRAWMRKYDSDADNLCRLAMRCVLVVSDERKILIDLGMGNSRIKEAAYYQPQKIKDIPDLLLEQNLTAEDITDVVLTHLHFDHCGCATSLADDGSYVPAFKNARYWLSDKQWQNFKRPNRLEADSIFSSTIQPFYDSCQLNLIDKDCWLTKGIELRLYDGHSDGQIVVFIETSKGIVVTPSDLIPTSVHVPIEWISAYDISAIKSASEKLRFLSEVVEKDYTLIYYHDEKVVSSKVKCLNDNFKACNKRSI